VRGPLPSVVLNNANIESRNAGNLTLPLSKARLMNYCTESKVKSLILQDLLANCSVRDAESVSFELEDQVHILINDQFGNYVIQRLAGIIASFSDKLVIYCERHFLNLAYDESSSRVLQYLIELSSKFRQIAAIKLKENIGLALTRSTAAHLLTALIKNIVDFQDVHFLLDMIQKEKSWIQSKCFFKIMIVFKELCPLSELDRVFYLLKIKKEMLWYLKGKLSSSLVLSLILRCHRRTVDLFISTISSNFKPLIGTASFCNLMAHLIDKGSKSLKLEIGIKLTELRGKALRCLMIEKAEIYYYLYITTSFLSIEPEGQKLKEFLVRR
jgi:Pumilio-family RNA binding repeat